MKICIVASEVAPFAKTGGLADVAASLARYLAGAGHDVRLTMPMYGRLRGQARDFTPHRLLQDIPITLGSRRYNVSISTTPLPPATAKNPASVFFVRCPDLYDREGIYTTDADEHVRFGLLSQASLIACQWSQWSPDIVHCNDWHTALIPLYLKSHLAWDKLFQRTKSVLTIHNIGYQGVFGADKLGELDLENIRHLLYREDLDEGRVNFLKTGLLYADALTTVSETYAREIQGDELGMGLGGVLRARRDALFGIVNGVDYGEWDPATDRLIPHRYTPQNLEPKLRNREELLKRFELAPAATAPTLGIVSRLTYQKGFELLSDSLPVLLHQHDVRLVVLGSGEERYERYFHWLRETFPRKVAFHAGYDNQLAHWIEAGADMFLMPSRYEPCGLNQMYSLKYGTVPIVRRTGGLADTVEPFHPATGEGTGFVFDGFTAHALLDAVLAAIAVYRDPSLWRKLMRNGMAKDFSWEKQGHRYVELYERLSG